jgi:hypothetical protein
MLVGLDRFYEIGGVHETFVCPGVQPCKALAEKFDVQESFLKVNPVQIGDLKFTPCAWFQIFGIFNNT